MNHTEIIKTLCRLCGKFIEKNKHYKNPKLCVEFRDLIKLVYDVVIDNDNPDIHPDKICSNCCRKLRRLENETNLVKQHAYVFTQHQDPCSRCESFTAPKKNSLNVKTLDSVIQKAQFFKIANPLKDFKRSYIKADCSLDGSVTTKLSITICNDDSWILAIYGKVVKSSILTKYGFPEIIYNNEVDGFITLLCSLNICSGNSDFVDVIDSKLDFPVLSQTSEDGAQSTSIETNAMCKLDKKAFSVIRSTDCDIICLNGKICENCLKVRHYLRTVRSRLKSKSSSSISSQISTSNIRYLPRQELEERYRACQQERRVALTKLEKLKSKVEALISKQGVSLDENLHETLSDVMSKQTNDFQEGTTQWLLWQQQHEMATKKDSRGMRWHPLIIRWCLSIYHKSPAAFKQLSDKSIGFLRLPHVNTLKKHIHFSEQSIGFNPDVLELLRVESNVDNLPEFKKNVTLIFDEMKIKSDLVYKKSTGQLIGFKDVGDINKELEDYSNCLEKETGKESTDTEFASYVLVFMVRGIFSTLIFPFGYFATTGVTSAELYPCVWDSTKVLESLGFYVRAFVCDGASPNRKFFSTIAGENQYFTTNIFAPHRKIYLFSDYCHLIKTTRNCFENSSGHLKTRHLMLDGKEISWKHIVDVYEWDLGLNRNALGLRMLHKFREEHVHLSPRLRMQVKLAVQVLSETTAKCLKMQGLDTTSETVKFVEMFDKVFDCLNVSRMNDHITKRKPELAPYTSVDDWRFEFLEKEFLEGYLKRWENQVAALPNLPADEKNKFYISKQTSFGWYISIKSFVELSRLMLQEEGVKFLLSERFSQDPLEQHFSKQRSAGGCNDNPTLYQYGKQELALNVMGSHLITGLKGNTRIQGQRNVIDIHDKRKLPQKVKKEKLKNEDITGDAGETN